jgi:hypothetical protein
MIHHLALAFHVRERAALMAQDNNQDRNPKAPSPGRPAPVRPRPITPWSAPRGLQASTLPRVRISSDPSDARRTVIAGRFAEVCAALDRLVREQEAIA